MANTAPDKAFRGKGCFCGEEGKFGVTAFTTPVWVSAFQPGASPSLLQPGIGSPRARRQLGDVSPPKLPS